MKTAILYARLVLTILLTVCIFIGTFGSQLKQSFGGMSYFYLYKIAGMQAIYFADAGKDFFVCPKQFNMINTSFAMGVMGCACMLVGMVLAAAMVVAPSSKVGSGTLLRGKATLFASIAACICIVLCVIITSITFTVLLCDDPLAAVIDDDATYDYGYYFICISTGLSVMWLGFETWVGLRGGGGVGSEVAHLIA